MDADGDQGNSVGDFVTVVAFMIGVVLVGVFIVMVVMIVRKSE